MKKFMDEDFLLETDIAKDLYHNHAAKMPIIDYHCHLDPKMVAVDHHFQSITELWLGGDHYKWRAMRTNGVDERYCTGTDTSDWEKFERRLLLFLSEIESIRSILDRVLVHFQVL